MAFAEDMSVFFSAAEFAVLATFVPFGEAPLTASVMLNTPDDDILGGRIQTTEYLATMPTGTFPGISRGNTVAIDGAGYTVREVKQIGDGGLKTVSLSKT